MVMWIGWARGGARDGWAVVVLLHDEVFGCERGLRMRKVCGACLLLELRGCFYCRDGVDSRRKPSFPGSAPATEPHHKIPVTEILVF